MKKTVLLLALLVLVAGCITQAQAPSAPASALGTASVIMRNYTFDPAELTVPVGTNVTWTNLDSVAHRLTGGPLASGTLQYGASYSYKFDKAGTYEYNCGLYSYIRGKVIVK